MGIFFIESVKLYTSQNIWVFWTAFFISIGFLIGLTCCGDVRRKSPHNMILLSGFTVAEGLMLGVACSTYTAESVLMGKNHELNNKRIFIRDMNYKINCKMGNDLFLSFFSPTAVGICALVVLGLTIFALQTKIDFTMCNGILFVLVLCLMIFGIFCAIFPSNIMNVVYASLGAVIFSCYIVVDT